MQMVVGSRQLTDVQPCSNKNANMIPVPGLRPERRIVINRDWKTLLRSSANNMLTRRLYDVPRASFANKSELRRE